MDGSELVFRPLVEAAPAGVELITVAYPPGVANTYEELLPRVREALPRERPFYLLGWSFSGPLALMVAAARPPLLRGVILASSFVRAPIPILPRWARHLARPLLFRLYPAASRGKALLGGHATPALLALLAEAHARAGHEALACRARAAMEVDATAALAACAVPVLYLRASADEVIAASRADEIRRVRPTAEVAEIPGPHLALVTNPAAAWAVLDRFMR
jgi:pimeloyl-ACP methyl ester carboxylesterase